MREIRMEIEKSYKELQLMYENMREVKYYLEQIMNELGDSYYRILLSHVIDKFDEAIFHLRVVIDDFDYFIYVLEKYGGEVDE